MTFGKTTLAAAGVIAVSVLGGPGNTVAAAAPAQTVVNEPPAPPPNAPACGPWKVSVPHWDFGAPGNALDDWCTKWQNQPQNGVRDGGGGTVFGA